MGDLENKPHSNLRILNTVLIIVTIGVLLFFINLFRNIEKISFEEKQDLKEIQQNYNPPATSTILQKNKPAFCHYDPTQLSKPEILIQKASQPGLVMINTENNSQPIFTDDCQIFTDIEQPYCLPKPPNKTRVTYTLKSKYYFNDKTTDHIQLITDCGNLLGLRSNSLLSQIKEGNFVPSGSDLSVTCEYDETMLKEEENMITSNLDGAFNGKPITFWIKDNFHKISYENSKQIPFETVRQSSGLLCNTNSKIDSTIIHVPEETKKPSLCEQEIPNLKNEFKIVYVEEFDPAKGMTVERKGIFAPRYYLYMNTEAYGAKMTQRGLEGMIRHLEENRFFNTQPEYEVYGQVSDCRKGSEVGENANYFYCYGKMLAKQITSPEGTIERKEGEYKLRVVLNPTGNIIPKQISTYTNNLEFIMHEAEIIDIACE